MSSDSVISAESETRSFNPVVGVLAIAFGHLALEACNNMLPVLYPTLIERLNLSYTQVGVVAFVHGAFGSFPQPFFGWLADHKGARWLGWASLIWLGVWGAMVGYTSSYGVLLACVALMAISSATYHPVGGAAASLVSSRRAGVATSVFSLGGSIGVALSPLIGAAIVAGSDLQGTVWLLPIGVVSSLLLWRYLPSLKGRSVGTPKTASSDGGGAILALVLVIALSICQGWFTRVFRDYTPLMFAARGEAETLASLVLFASSICGAVGTIVGGFLSDRTKPYYVIVGAWLLTIPAYALYVTAYGTFALVLAGLMGFLTASNYPIVIVLASRSWPNRPALATGLALGIGWGSAGLGVTLAGVLADRYGLLPAMKTALIPAGLSIVLGLALGSLLARSSRRVPS